MAFSGALGGPRCERHDLSASIDRTVSSTLFIMIWREVLGYGKCSPCRKDGRFATAYFFYGGMG
jgi:hypothetical protein